MVQETFFFALIHYRVSWGHNHPLVIFASPNTVVCIFYKDHLHDHNATAKIRRPAVMTFLIQKPRSSLWKFSKNTFHGNLPSQATCRCPVSLVAFNLRPRHPPDLNHILAGWSGGWQRLVPSLTTRTSVWMPNLAQLCIEVFRMKERKEQKEVRQKV